jgi:hypothetical protein
LWFRQTAKAETNFSLQNDTQLEILSKNWTVIMRYVIANTAKTSKKLSTITAEK